MTRVDDSEIVGLLNRLGSEWLGDRPWILADLSENHDGDGYPTLGPAFIFRWRNGHGPVAVSFLPDGSCHLPGFGMEILIIELGRGELTLRSPGLTPCLIETREATHSRQLGEITGEARAAAAEPPHWRHRMTLVTAAFRLLALSHAAATLQTPATSPRGAPKKDQLATRLHQWLRPILADPVKLGDAARHFGKSPRQLIRILKETTGAGFAEHLAFQRLHLARSLLMRTDRSVMEVARASGFNSREQFIRSFNRNFGWTPLQFRKAWHRATLGNSDLTPLCTVLDRPAVAWLAAGSAPPGPGENQDAPGHTLIVANARREIIELFRISPTGKPVRHEIIESGAMALIHREIAGSCWQVRTPGSVTGPAFVTPPSHSLALVSPATLDS